MKLSELEEGSRLSLRVITNNKKIQFHAILKKHVRDNIALITLISDIGKKLKFDNVRTDMEFCPAGDVPFIWYNVKIVSYKDDDYALQVFSDGAKHNRRGSFRVGVSSPARIKNPSPGMPREVMVRDVSLTGFSVSDRKGELSLSSGDMLSVYWEDFGHMLDLTGRVVRTEEQEGVTIYGLELCNVCKDLSSYVSKRQRQKK